LLINSKNGKEVEVEDCFAFSSRKVSKTVMYAFSDVDVVLF